MVAGGEGLGQFWKCHKGLGESIQVAECRAYGARDDRDVPAPAFPGWADILAAVLRAFRGLGRAMGTRPTSLPNEAAKDGHPNDGRQSKRVTPR